jgi:hypothetical protein
MAGVTKAGPFFRTPLTRPLRWAIPLAIAGYVILIVLPLVGVAVRHQSCLPSTTVIENTQTHTVIQRQVINRDCLNGSQPLLCTGVALPLFVLCQLPVTFLAIRGFLWGANALYDLQQRIDS